MRAEAPQAPIPQIVRHASEISPSPARRGEVPGSSSRGDVVMVAANAKPGATLAPAAPKLQGSMSFSGQTVPQPQVAIIRPNIQSLQAEHTRSPSPLISRSQTPTRPVPRHEESSYNSALAESLDPATVTDYSTKLRMTAQNLAVGSSGQAELFITPDVLAQLDGVFTTAFKQNPTGPDYGKVYALLTQGDDVGKEHCLRILTHITLQIDNQKAVAGSGLLKPIAQLLTQNNVSLQMLAAWTISNLATHDPNRDKLRDTIPSLIFILTGHSGSACEQALRAFANLLKGHEPNKTVFMRNYGVPLTVHLLKRRELGENVMVLSLRALMLLTWNAEVKTQAFGAGGLHSVLELLNHSNAGVRKMASWIANNMCAILY